MDTPIEVNPVLLSDYRAPAWLPGGNLQTLWPALRARSIHGNKLRYQRERWVTPDGDFIDVDCKNPPGFTNQTPLLILFHGLEGTSNSHYAQSFAAFSTQQGYCFAVPHFRGCSGEINLAPRAYHSGDYEEIAWILARFRAQHHGPIWAVGISLGGNALMRWAGEAGRQARRVLDAVASICAPLDLAAGGLAIGQGFNRIVYTRMFLNTMKPKAMQKLAQFPGLFDQHALLSARDLYQFDNAFTAPLHGFKDTADYWRRASAKPGLAHVRVPALVVNARNDPFVPAESLPCPRDVGAAVRLWQPAQGGHVGFPQGGPSEGAPSVPAVVGRWLAGHRPH